MQQNSNVKDLIYTS